MAFVERHGVTMLSGFPYLLAENLTPFMIPEFIVKMPQIPLNTNGKPDMSRMPVVMKEGQAYERIG